MPSIAYSMKIAAQNVQTVIVPNSGHWIPEEQPEFVIEQIAEFFAGNTTDINQSTSTLAARQIPAPECL